VTTLVVVGGFAVLTAARFRVVVLMGVLTSSAALFALFVDLVGFPALLFTLSRYPTIRRILERNDP
jgi:predicted RND superfamily exporter protein